MPKTQQTKRHSPFASRDKHIAELEAQLSVIEKESVAPGHILDGTEIEQITVNTLNSQHHYRHGASGPLLLEEITTALDRHKEEWVSMLITLLRPDYD